MPRDWPQYVPRRKVVEYLDDYAAAFGIEPRFGRKVVSVDRSEDGGWRVSTAQGEAIDARHVVVATGFNRRPRSPSWPGMDGFRGSILHSVDYRNGEKMSGSRVLVVGMGNTGAEIALDLFEHGARPYISVRGPVNIVPRDILGRPTAKTALMLMRFPPWFGDPIGSFLRRVTTGDLSRYGIRTPRIPPLAQLRETGATPVVDVGTVARIKSGDIGVVGEIARFEPEGVALTDGSALTCDHVVLATGYESAVGDFIPDVAGALNPDGHPAGLWGAGRHEGLYFAGFNGYSPGGLLRSIRLEAPRIAERIARAP